MPEPLDKRTKLSRQLDALKERRRLLDRQIWALEQEMADLPQPEPRRRSTDRAEMASA